MKNTEDLAGGKLIAVLLQAISGVSAINPLVTFYDIHGGKREVIFFYFVPDTTLFLLIYFIILHMAFAYTYYSRIIPKVVAEASQVFFRNAHVLPN
jgi:hypothetical protein